MQQSFGYTREDLKFFLDPMAEKGEDPIGSMGRDIPLASLSDKPRMLYDYFFQNLSFLDIAWTSSNFSFTYHPAAKPMINPIVVNIIVLLFKVSI